MSYTNLSIALCYDERNVRETIKSENDDDNVYIVEIVHENKDHVEESNPPCGR